MEKYYHGPTVDDIKNYEIEDWSKKFIVDMISYFIRRAVVEYRIKPRTSIAIPTVLFGYERVEDLDWLNKELEEAGFKVTIEKEEDTVVFDNIPVILDGVYIISWGDK